MRVNGRNRALLLAAGMAILLSALAGCGFNDTLTTRGFIKAGDTICGQTLARTGAGFTPSTSQADFLRAIGRSYGAAARRFRALDVRSDDQPIRNKVVAQYTSFSRQLESAAGTADLARVRGVFADSTDLQLELKSYGFDTCGGGGGNPSAG
jgi:hypothetical protein